MENWRPFPRENTVEANLTPAINVSLLATHPYTPYWHCQIRLLYAYFQGHSNSCHEAALLGQHVRNNHSVLH